MKVLFLFGGLPHYYNKILNKLNDIPELEISVIVPKKDGQSLGKGVYETNKGINFKVIRLKEYKAFYKKPFFKDIKQTIKEEQPQAIVIGWPYFLGFLFSPALRKLLKKQNIKLIHKDIPYKMPKYQDTIKYYASGKGFVDENLEDDQKKTSGLLFYIKFKFLAYLRKKYFNWVDAHVDYIEEAYEIFESYGVPKERIHIIYNSPDTDYILNVREQLLKEPPLLAPNPYRLIHVGRLVKWKKVHLLVEAVRRLKPEFSEIELVIVGGGPEEDNLKAQVKEAGLEANTTFTGPIHETKELGRYLLDSSVYVLAGVGGLSINDAMCFDKAVICSECDGTEKKLLREDYNGRFFENDNVDDLTQQIRILLSDPDKIKVMGQNSLGIIQNEINVHTVIKGYVDAFKFVNKGTLITEG
ncbi:glycosyltransferase [Microscilla marina]|uniref:Putative glycosyltransferase n=1 Tax=Microscilla marina ATCC 23134 TaxID=313606 RepID=A1ZTZ8_MICM2|nr:glycosyltransferase [Microscilla marina]EAY26111.1 putative glycosyltransferase [Microscilla marina ATCC 23134]